MSPETSEIYALNEILNVDIVELIYSPKIRGELV
jgi:hypothetical protein